MAIACVANANGWRVKAGTIEVPTAICVVRASAAAARMVVS